MEEVWDEIVADAPAKGIRLPSADGAEDALEVVGEMVAKGSGL